jgi:hypothetical protein
MISGRLVRGQRSLWVRSYSLKSGEKAGFNKHLEAVAYAEDRAALVYKGFKFFAEFGDEPLGPNGASPNIVAEGKASGKNEGVKIHKVSLFNYFVGVQYFSLNA